MKTQEKHLDLIECNTPAQCWRFVFGEETPTEVAARGESVKAVAMSLPYVLRNREELCKKLEEYCSHYFKLQQNVSEVIKGCTCDLVHPARVESIEIERCRPPSGGGSLDDTGAGRSADEIIKMLDRHYSREQVHAIARWMVYLSTQA